MISIGLKHNHLGDESVVCGYTVTVELPALSGSPKQVAYADAIRRASIVDFVVEKAIRPARMEDGQWVKDMTFNSPELRAIIAKLNVGCQQLDSRLATITSAKVWIDAANGSKSLTTVLAINTMISKGEIN